MMADVMTGRNRLDRGIGVGAEVRVLVTEIPRNRSTSSCVHQHSLGC